MHRTFVGDLQQAARVAPRRDCPAGRCARSMRSIIPSLVSQVSQSAAWISAVAELDRDALERQRLALGIEPKRHRRAGAQSGEHEIVRTRTAVEAADIGRLVRQEAMPPDRDLLLKAAATRFANNDGVGFVRQVGRGLRHVEIALGPGVDHVGDVGRRRCGGSSRWSAPASETKLFGCLAAVKMWLAFSIPTMSSVGE